MCRNGTCNLTTYIKSHLSLLKYCIVNIIQTWDSDASKWKSDEEPLPSNWSDVRKATRHSTSIIIISISSSMGLKK